MGGKCPHRKVSKRRYSHKSNRRAKFLVKGDDAVYDTLKKVETGEAKPLPVDEDLPGMGQYYCFHCDRYFATVTVRDDHFKTKRHKKRLKMMSSDIAPHCQVDADLAAGMGLPDNGPKLMSISLSWISRLRLAPNPCFSTKQAKITATIDALKEEGKPIDENAIYYDVVGGHKKGHVFGVGTAKDMFFSKPHHVSTSTSKTSTYVPGIISQLSSRITDTEELLRKEREDKEKYVLAQQESENELHKLRADFQALQDLVRNALPNCSNAFTATPRDPRDPSSGGGDGSGASMGFAAV